MLHFRMDMPFYLMALYGSVLIVIVLLLRGLLKNRMPKFVFPVFWGMVLLRLLVPFSLSSPLSLPFVPQNPFGDEGLFSETSVAVNTVPEDGEGLLIEGGAKQNQAVDTAYFSNSGSGWLGGVAEDRTIVPQTGTEDRKKETGYGNAEDTIVQASEVPSGYVLTEAWHVPYFRWRILVPAVYFLGLGVTAGILGWRKYCCSRRLRNGFLIENNTIINDMLRSMGMGHVLVFTSDEIASPMVCGLMNSRIYLPVRMDFQDRALLRNIFAHETMHIRRRDNWIKVFMLAALCLNWYNPLVWIMSKCLSSDLEAACDGAVLRECNEEERKDYARSLLAMAVSASRTSLLYSAFSRTEVEKRIKGILNYRKTTVFALLISVLFLAGGGVVFATGGQAPFSSALTSYCASSNSRWGVKVSVTRDIALDENAQERAENAIFSVLNTDKDGDPEVLEEAIREALAKEFGVEKRAFSLLVSLCLSKEEVEQEYARWEIKRGEDGFWLYQGEQIRVFEDKMLGSYQSKEEGKADIFVQRDRLGRITAVTVWKPGDSEFDRRTHEREQYRQRLYW